MAKSTRVISFSGKGGSGKTTTSSLFLASILKLNKFKNILVIDADPDANLSRTLGVNVENTVGKILDKRKKRLNDQKFMGTQLRSALMDTISRGEGFDIIVMGRTTGEGCYCSVNSVLSYLLQDTFIMYDMILIDFDAGLEHFSRKTANPMDTLIVTCDPSRLSFDTAKRINCLVDELGLSFSHRYLVGCRYNDEQRLLFPHFAEDTGYEILGLVPYDAEIASRNLVGKCLLDLEAGNPAWQAVDQMVPRVLFPYYA